jgi:hypothetical protein
MARYSSFVAFVTYLFICIQIGDSLSPQNQKRGSSRRAFVLEHTVPIAFATTAFTIVSTVSANSRSQSQHNLLPAGIQHGSDCSCMSCMTGGNIVGTISNAGQEGAMTGSQQHGQDCTCSSCLLLARLQFVKYERTPIA